MDPYQALYGWRFRSYICLFEVGEYKFIGPNLVNKVVKKWKLFTKGWKKNNDYVSYPYVRRRDLEYKC